MATTRPGGDRRSRRWTNSRAFLFVVASAGISILLNMRSFGDFIVMNTQMMGMSDQPGTSASNCNSSDAQESHSLAWTHVASQFGCNAADNDPVYDSIDATVEDPIQVGVITSRNPTLLHEGKHILLDGVIGSSLLALRTICYMEGDQGCPQDDLYKDVQLWIIDIARCLEPPPQKMEMMKWLIQAPNPHWKVLLVDYSDFYSRGWAKEYGLKRPKGDMQTSLNAGGHVINGTEPAGAVAEGEDVGDVPITAATSATMSTTIAPVVVASANATPDVHKTGLYPHVRYAVRSRVRLRRWQSNLNAVYPGKLDHKIHTYTYNTGGAPIPAPYAVRGDIVNALRLVLPTFNHTDQPMSPQLSKASVLTGFAKHPPPHTHRPVDVIHLWNAEDTADAGNFRSMVSKTLNKLNGKMIYPINETQSAAPIVRGPSLTPQRPIVASTKIQGNLGSKGRNGVDERYVTALLSAKIVVVTQRDEWEDHYRLFEAMAHGPLVIHDAMLAAPVGVEDGKSIVFFHNITDLRRKIRYYLQHEEDRMVIAQNGWMIAMGRHRSWHRMEGIIFGCPLTGVF